MINWTLFTNTKIIGPWREKAYIRWLENNKAADQPARMRSLIRDFVIRLLESIMLAP